MDYSAAVIPVTKADKRIDLFNSDYHPLNGLDQKNWEACKYNSRNIPVPILISYPPFPRIDDPDVYDGAPVGVQIVARKHEEEKVWAIAKIIDAALKAANVH